MAGPALRLAGRVRRGACTALESVQRCLDAVDAFDDRIHSCRETYRDDACRVAERIDARIAAGDDPGPLAGVPITVKDNIATSIGRTSCGSRLLETYRSPYDATVIERLADAGAIIVGKTNCDEFAMGSSTEHCAFGPTRNPWDLERVPGGSSGGSAAAVAADLCVASLGSDTGGSIRQPGAMCGVVGVKPSYGRVSRYGLVAFGSSLDQAGPITRSVSDAALVLQTIAGVDRRDATSADEPVGDYLARIDEPVPDLKVGVPRQYLAEDNDPGVNEAIRAAIGVLESAGAEIVDVDLPLTSHGVSTYYVIAPAEASSNLARFDGIRYGRRADTGDGDLFELYARSRAEGFGPEVQRRIMLGTYVLSAGYYDAYYKRALQVRRLIKQEVDAAFDRCHCLVGPTAPAPACRLGELEDPLSMYLGDVYTTIANIAGHCAISVPAGFASVDGTPLPVGLQIQCRAFDEATMFRVARTFERATDHHETRPPLVAEPAA